MILKPPFHISSALAPALKIGEATLSLLSIKTGDRDTATFELQTPDFTYTDDQLRSGCLGFHSTVDTFENFLSFMEACGESYPDGENADLFPPHVAQWCSENMDELSMARCDICDEDGNPSTTLIEE